MTNSAITGQRVLIAAENRGYRSLKMPGWAGHMGNVGVIQDFDFSGSSGILTIDSPTSFAGTIFNFQPGDTIDLAGISATGAAIAAGNVLTLQQTGGSAISISLDPNQSYSSDSLLISPDGAGGTDITIQPGAP